MLKEINIMRKEIEQRLHRVKITLYNENICCPYSKKCDKAENCDRCNKYFKKCSKYKENVKH